MAPTMQIVNANGARPERVLALQYMTAAGFFLGMTSMVTTMMLDGLTALAQVDRGEKAPYMRRSAR